MPQFDDRDATCLQVMASLARTWMETALSGPDTISLNSGYDADKHFEKIMPSPAIFAQYAYGMFDAAIQEKTRERVTVPDGAAISAFAPTRR